MTRMVHIADSHLGLSVFNRTNPKTGVNIREELIYDNFMQSMEMIATKYRPDVVVHAGDLFHYVRPKTAAYRAAFDGLSVLLDAEIPVVISEGNHSMVRNPFTASPFDLLRHKGRGLYIASQFQARSIEIGDAKYHLIPNMLTPEDYLYQYQSVIKPQIGPNYNVLVTHGLVEGVGHLNTVAECDVPTAIIDDPVFDYIALGHIHDQMRLRNNCWYSGSTEYCNYGERHTVKGGLLVTLSSDGPLVESIPFPHTPMIDLGTIDARDMQMSAIVETLTERFTNNRNTDPNAMYHCIVTGTRNGIPAAELKHIRADCLDLKVRIDKTGLDEECTGHPDDLSDIRFDEEFIRFANQAEIRAPIRQQVINVGSCAINEALKELAEEDRQ